MRLRYSIDIRLGEMDLVEEKTDLEAAEVGRALIRSCTSSRSMSKDYGEMDCLGCFFTDVNFLTLTGEGLSIAFKICENSIGFD